jgi:hypothetical protein
MISYMMSYMISYSARFQMLQPWVLATVPGTRDLGKPSARCWNGDPGHPGATRTGPSLIRCESLAGMIMASGASDSTRRRSTKTLHGRTLCSDSAVLPAKCIVLQNIISICKMCMYHYFEHTKSIYT